MFNLVDQAVFQCDGKLAAAARAKSSGPQLNRFGRQGQPVSTRFPAAVVDEIGLRRRAERASDRAAQFGELGRKVAAVGKMAQQRIQMYPEVYLDGGEVGGLS